jgi:hypothetical protein
MAILHPAWPFQYQDDAPAETEKAWGWFGMPAAGEGMLFEAGAVPWVEHDWLAPLGYQMEAGEFIPPAGPPPQRMMTGLGL